MYGCLSSALGAAGAENKGIAEMPIKTISSRTPIFLDFFIGKPDKCKIKVSTKDQALKYLVIRSTSGFLNRLRFAKNLLLLT